MSTIKVIRQQLGLSGTATNNFTLDASADNGTMKLARGNAGATTQNVMTVDAAGKVTFPQMLLPTYPTFIGSNAGSGTIASNAATKVNLSTVSLDSHNWWSVANTRYVPQVSGFYEVVVSIVGNSSTSNLQLCAASVAKNGSVVREGSYIYGSGLANVSDALSSVNLIVQMNGTTDYLEPFARLVGGGTLAVSNFYMHVKLVRAA